MIIDCISDLHGHYPKLQGGDLLIVAGDFTARDMPHERIEFLSWLSHQKYKKTIWIAGNHDNSLIGLTFRKTREDAAEYLCDSGTEFEYEVQVPHPACNERVSIDVLMYETKKLKIWGSPWTLGFEGMNPKCKAFTVDTEEELAEKWALIPDDVDILVTHSPPYGILDRLHNGDNVGSYTLGNLVLPSRKDECYFPKLKLHVFGHIHEYGGHKMPHINRNVLFVNASHVNERYEPVNKPVRIIV